MTTRPEFAELKPNYSIQISRQIELRPIASLRPSARNARTHSKAQVAQIARSIEQFGFRKSRPFASLD